MEMEKRFESYYEQEFNMLKDAHFQTSQKIISFFQYALLIFSAPLALLTSDQISRAVLGTVFVAIGVIEILVVAYLTSLRSEALMYARQINRIRSVLYSKKLLGDDPKEINNNKIMLSQDKKPDYKDKGQFIFIVLVLGAFASFYFSFGTYKLLTNHYGFDNIKRIVLISLVSGMAIFLISYFVYCYISISNENGTAYYKNIIGVDIDGVLNRHEETFVSILKQVTSKEICVSDIKSLPVHMSTNVSREDEHKVFETKEYWEQQELSNDAKECLIQEIKNKLGFKVFVFTWRDWKVKRDINGKKIRFNIQKHTKIWLKNKEISFNKIKFEKGNYDRPVSVFGSKYKTRYYYAKKFKIRYFVEDNLRNAEKLSHICDYVFLINHPYNESGSLPYNVIRVTKWEEIVEWIKQFN